MSDSEEDFDLDNLEMEVEWGEEAPNKEEPQPSADNPQNVSWDVPSLEVFPFA